MKTSIGIWDITLWDDGTLDTVLTVTMRVCPSRTHDVRFSYTSEHRNEDGSLSEEGFWALAQEAVEQVYMLLFSR